MNSQPVEALKDIVFGGEDINTTALEAEIWKANLSKNFSDTLKEI